MTTKPCSKLAVLSELAVVGLTMKLDEGLKNFPATLEVEDLDQEIGHMVALLDSAEWEYDGKTQPTEKSHLKVKCDAEKKVVLTWADGISKPKKKVRVVHICSHHCLGITVSCRLGWTRKPIAVFDFVVSRRNNEESINIVH